MTKFENLDKVLEDINKLKEAAEILDKLWIVFEPYELERIIREKGYNSELITDIHNYFGFNDGE